jgi:hypothetical protein
MNDSLFLLRDELDELAALLDRTGASFVAGQADRAAMYGRLHGAALRASALVHSLESWANLARWCSAHAKERRIGCNEYAGGKWKVWAEWNDDVISVGSGVTADEAAASLCQLLDSRSAACAIPRSAESAPAVGEVVTKPKRYCS